MLALNLGGVRYPWASAPILGLFAGARSRRVFVARLITAPEPLIPIPSSTNPVVRCSIAANAFGWGASSA